MELEDNYNLLQDNVISVLRNYPRFLTLLKCIAPRLDNLQDIANYLCENTKLDFAEGIWLDYIGWLVGTTRDTFDILQYFCVNAEHLNVEKLFYFEGVSSLGRGSLQDVYFRKKIKAKVAYNTSRATRNENIKIIQGMFNADLVIITKVEPMVLDITIYGDNIYYPSTASLRDSIIKILGNGVNIRNLVTKPKEKFFVDVTKDDEVLLPNDEMTYEIIEEV